MPFKVEYGLWLLTYLCLSIRVNMSPCVKSVIHGQDILILIKSGAVEDWTGYPWIIWPVAYPLQYCSSFQCPTDAQMSRCMTKSTKWSVRPAKTQISLGIRPVRSIFPVHLIGSQGIYMPTAKADQTGRIPRLIHVFAGRTCYCVRFVVCRLK